MLPAGVPCRRDAAPRFISGNIYRVVEPADTEDLLQRFHATLLAMDAARVEVAGQPRNWNRLVDQLQWLDLQLRETDAGRAGISGFLQDDNVTVRQWAAAFALAWEPASARPELERQAANEPGLTGFNAKIALQEFDAGRTVFTWIPKRRRPRR